jgi:MoaA/NifB/PqqE/SkfB family radical SAM enzyme
MKSQDKTWRVVPLSKGQLKDVRSEDILNNGHFRKCNTYRGGGGYDQFPIIAEKIFGRRYHKQFIVQLFGCNLDCPYCYVTRAGVWGKPVSYTSKELVSRFLESGQETFHLMGGAPALYIDHWTDIMKLLPNHPFHSDIMLSEKEYDLNNLKNIASIGNGLFAVNIKGMTPEEHLKNTRKPFLEDRMWRNLHKVVESKVDFYFTFTNVSKENQKAFWQKYSFLDGATRKDSFSIDLIEYDALPYVDEVPWGKVYEQG